MKNVTISMDDQLLRRVQAEAGKAGVSVSRWIARAIARSLGVSDEKAAASARIERFLATFPGLPLSENGKITIDRDELYDDGRFRRFDSPAVPARSEDAGEASNLRGVAEDPAVGGRTGPEPSKPA
jgi:predicted transcriptional regulator